MNPAFNWKQEGKVSVDKAVSVIAFATAFILLALSLLHVYWALARPWGSGGAASSALVPTKDNKALFQPSRLSTFAVASALLLAAMVTLGSQGCWGSDLVPALVFRLGLWTLFVVFAARAVGEFRYIGFFKSAKESKFAKLDTALYTPLCFVLSLMFLIMAVAIHLR